MIATENSYFQNRYLSLYVNDELFKTVMALKTIFKNNNIGDPTRHGFSGYAITIMFIKMLISTNILPNLQQVFTYTLLIFLTNNKNNKLLINSVNPVFPFE